MCALGAAHPLNVKVYHTLWSRLRTMQLNIKLSKTAPVRNQLFWGGCVCYVDGMQPVFIFSHLICDLAEPQMCVLAG